MKSDTRDVSFSTHKLLRASLAAGLLFTCLSAQVAHASAPGSTTATGSMANVHHNGHTATLLANGRVLVAGGLGPNDTTQNTADIYDPTTGVWSPAAPMTTLRNLHTATRLQSGLVLVTGGIEQSVCDSDCTYPVRTSAELYNPLTNTWKLTARMKSPRAQHTATLLNDGRVLVAGGCDAAPNRPTAEIYNPKTGKWKATEPMTAVRWAHTATLLADGKVLVAGGYEGSVALQTAEIFDPATGVWTPTSSMATPRGFHTDVRLQAGRVLVVGGLNETFPLPWGFSAIASAEIYDPTTGAWTSASAMASPRFAHTATLLGDGSVLIAGGEDQDISVLQSTEVYDPQTDTWSPGADMTSRRATHSATRLLSGEVLLAGGFFIGSPLATAEIFAP